MNVKILAIILILTVSLASAIDYDYWIDGNGTANHKVWLNASNNSQIIKMYAFKGCDVNLSNGTNTFTFYRDVNNRNELWTDAPTDVEMNVSGSNMWIDINDPSGTEYGYWNITSLGINITTPVKIILRASSSDTTANQAGWFGREEILGNAIVVNWIPRVVGASYLNDWVYTDGGGNHIVGDYFAGKYYRQLQYINSTKVNSYSYLDNYTFSNSYLGATIYTGGTELFKYITFGDGSATVYNNDIYLTHFAIAYSDIYGAEPTINYGNWSSGNYNVSGHTCNRRFEINYTSNASAVMLDYLQFNDTKLFFSTETGGTGVITIENVTETVSSYNYLATLSKITADAINNPTTINATVVRPDGTIALNNASMSGIGTWSWSGSVSLNEIGTWTINVYGDYSAFNSTTFSVSKNINATVSDGYFGYDTENLSTTAEISTLMDNYGYDLIGQTIVWEGFTGNKSTLLSNINHTYSTQNGQVFTKINFMATNYSKYSDVCTGIENNLTNYTQYPYKDGTAFFVLILNSSSSENITLFANEVASCIMDTTNNQFPIYSTYKNVSLDANYVSNYTLIQIVNANNLATSINWEAGYLRNSTELTRIYSGGNLTFLNLSKDYHSDIIGNLRDTPKGNSLPSDTRIGSLNNDDFVVFNSGASASNLSINNSEFQSGKDWWDYTFKTLLMNVQNSTNNTIEVDGYSFTLVYVDDFARIIVNSQNESTLYSASSDINAKLNYTQNTTAWATFTVLTTYDAIGELYDPSYTKYDNIFFHTYEVLSYSYEVDIGAYDLYVIAKGAGTNSPSNVNASLKVNGNQSILDNSFGYIAVNNYSNNYGYGGNTTNVTNCSIVNWWEDNKINESRNWTRDYRMNVFIDGFDIGYASTPDCFNERVTRLMDYINVDWNKETIANTYTIYAQIANKADYVMRESCFSNWSGAVGSPSYAYETPSLMFANAEYLTTAGKPVLCMAFGAIGDYDKQMYDFMGFAVLYGADGENRFRYAQPNFQIQREIRVPNIGNMLQRDWTNHSGGSYLCRQYSNGRACYSPFRNYTFDNGKYWDWENNEEVDSLIISQEFQIGATCTGVTDLYINISTVDSSILYRINACNNISAVAWTRGTVNFNVTNLYTETGHYNVHIYPQNRGNPSGVNMVNQLNTFGGVHSAWANPSNFPTSMPTWTNYARTGVYGEWNTTNWNMNIIVNKTTRASVDTDFTGITTNMTQLGSDPFNKRITIYGAKDYEIPVLTPMFYIGSSVLTNITYNGSIVNYTTNSNCNSDEPTLEYTTINAEQHGVCRMVNGSGYSYRILTPTLSDKVYDLFSNVTVYWIAPTPTNNTNSTDSSATYRFTTYENYTLSAGSKIEIDGVNYTCSISGDSKNCSYSPNDLIYNNTYDLKAWANISGTYYEGNETRQYDYYGCGRIISSQKMINNMNVNNQTCFRINGTNLVFDGDGYKIIGADVSTYYGINSTNQTNITISNFADISGFLDGIYYWGNNHTILNTTTNRMRCLFGCLYTNISNNTISNITIIGNSTLINGFDDSEMSYNTVNYINIQGLGVNSTIFNNTIEDGNLRFELTANWNNITLSDIYNNNLTNSTFILTGAYNTSFTRNYIYNNYFNTTIPFINATNYWNTTKTLGTNIIGGAYIGGNFYSNFTGYDYDGDGISDRPSSYPIDQKNIDYLPLTISRAYIHFILPTPLNNTNTSASPVELAFNSTVENMTSCRMQINGTNYTGTVNTSNRECLYNITSPTNANYTIIGWANISGTWFATNETRSFYWNGSIGEPTSFYGVKFNVSDFTFATSSYVEGVFVEFNTSQLNTSLVLMTSMNVERITGGGTSIVWARVYVDGVEQLEEELRTVSGLGDIGSTGTKPILFTLINGTHNISMEFRRTGGGTVGINDIDINLGQLLTTYGSDVRGQITNNIYTHASASFIQASNWTINKTITSGTYISGKFTINASGTATTDYYFNDTVAGGYSPYWKRYLSASSDIGSMAGTYIEIAEQGVHNHTIESKTSAGTVTVNYTLIDFDMRDNSTNTIQNFQASNASTNLTNNLTLTAGTYKITNSTITIQNGTSVFLSAMASFGTTSGSQTPTIFVNATTVPETNCYSKKERYLSGNNDVGNAFIYHICNNLTNGTTYNFNFWLIVPTGETVILYDESLSGFEVTNFSIAETSTPPPHIYFVSPTPTDSADNYTYGMIFNMTDTNNNKFASSGSVFTIDGVNRTCTVAGDSKSCSYTMPYEQHIFNNTYDVLGVANISGIFHDTNETRNFTYYGCGYINNNATLLASVNISGSTCFTLNASDINLTCNGYTIDGDETASTYGITSYLLQNNTIENCTIKEFIYGIGLNESAYNIIRNNTISSNNFGIYFLNSSYNNLTNNTAYDHSYHGISVNTISENNTIENNIVYNGTRSGIYIEGNYNNITNNTAYRSQYGIEIGTAFNIVSLSTSYNNTKYGIYARGSDNLFFNNTIYNNSIVGFYLAGNDNNISNNTIFNNTNFQLQSINSDCLIWNNNLTAFGTEGVVSDTGTNNWNTTQITATNIIGGASIGGNWYSNYTGYDGNGDGIGESTYLIFGGSNIDYLPLTNNASPFVVYFVPPTPTNNTNNFTYGMIFNISEIHNFPFGETGNNISINGITHNCTRSTDNLSCFYNLSYVEHIFNNTYDVIGYGNISGAIYPTNETRNFTYLGCGYVNANGTMLGNVSVNGSTCFTVNASDIYFNCNGSGITGNLTNNTYGFLGTSLENVSIENCTISSFGTGINITSSNNFTIRNNTVLNNIERGIFTRGFTNSTTEDNTAYNNTWGGISFWSNSDYNTITENTAYGNGRGILVYNASYNSVYNNTVYRNNFGIRIGTNADYNNVTNNTAYNNTKAQIYITLNADNNLIYNNIFNATGTQNATYDDSTNFWNITRNCVGTNIIGGNCTGGNYYSNAGCVDIDFDGICDNPNNISINAGSNIDYLPLTFCNRSMVTINDFYNINQNSSRDNLSVGDTLLYIYSILELNCTCSDNIRNYNLYVEENHWYNDSTANSSWKITALNISANSLNNMSNFEFRVPLTNATDDGFQGTYFGEPRNIQYTFIKNYTRNIFNTSTILPYPASPASSIKLYRCNESSCDINTATDWSLSLTFTHNSTDLIRRGDNIDDLVYVVSYDISGSSGGGGAPVANQTAEPADPEPPAEPTVEPIPDTEEYTQESRTIADWLVEVSDGEITYTESYLCEPWIPNTICGFGVVNRLACEWKSLTALYMPKFVSPINIILAILGLIAIAVVKRFEKIKPLIAGVVVIILIPVSFGLAILLAISLILLASDKKTYLFWIGVAFLLFTFIQALSFVVFALIYILAKIETGEWTWQ